jgi:outer membrane protein OmpA-like peptidoglycan-associated protein
MTSATAFDTNSTAVKAGFHPTLNKIAEVVNKYGKTSITIEGHTDSVGSDQANQVLSEKRAQAVQEYFESHKVASQRLTAVGKGEKEPVADNSNEAGRQRNRRVELLLEPVVAN